METTIEQALSIIRDHQGQRKLFFDIYAGSQKLTDKVEYDDPASEIEELISQWPDTRTFRIRMFRANGSTRPLVQEMLASREEAPKPSTMGNAEPDEDNGVPGTEIVDDEESGASVSVGPFSPKGTGGMKLDGSNPLSWVLMEKTSQLQQALIENKGLKQRVEMLRDKKEDLEKELIRKDNEITNLRGEVEGGKGLNGILKNNPDALTKGIEQFGNVLGSLLGGVRALPAGAPQYSEIANAVAHWINQNPDEGQQLFFQIFKIIAGRAQHDETYLNKLLTELNNGAVLSRSA